MTADIDKLLQGGSTLFRIADDGNTSTGTETCESGPQVWRYPEPFFCRQFLHTLIGL